MMKPLMLKPHEPQLMSDDSQGRYGQTQVFQTKPRRFTNAVHYHMFMMPNLCSQTWKVEHTFGGPNMLGTSS